MDGDSIVVEYEDCVKTDMVATADGQIDEAVAYENGKGTLTFTNGTVIWKDLVEGAADGQTFEVYVDEAAHDVDVVVADDDQNPIMNFVGNYGNGRATMTVSARGNDKAAISVTWGSSAAASSSWMMTGTAVADGDKIIVDYEDCTKTDILFDENGVAEETTVYENGKGTLTFSGSEVVWDDQVENIADGAAFTYYSAD